MLSPSPLFVSKMASVTEAMSDSSIKKLHTTRVPKAEQRPGARKKIGVILGVLTFLGFFISGCYIQPSKELWLRRGREGGISPVHSISVFLPTTTSKSRKAGFPISLWDFGDFSLQWDFICITLHDQIHQACLQL